MVVRWSHGRSVSFKARNLVRKIAGGGRCCGQDAVNEDRGSASLHLAGKDWKVHHAEVAALSEMQRPRAPGLSIRDIAGTENQRGYDSRTCTPWDRLEFTAS